MFLYSTVRPVKALYTLPPGRPVHASTNSASLESILATQQLRAKTIHSHFYHCQVLIYTLSELGQAECKQKLDG